MQSRRDFLKAGGIVLAGFGLLPNRLLRLPSAIEVIEMRSDIVGSHVWFDPIGLYVNPGMTVRWIARENLHTTTAYHPRNDHHSLRIPERALPWDSGFLVHPGDHFEVTLTVPGVYDYFCVPHEAAGMVGRIVVGESVTLGARPFDYWVGKPGTGRWRHVPEAARQTFPSVARILAERHVHPVSGMGTR
jgi:plastocyanin